MAAFAHTLSRLFGVEVDVETLEIIAIFSGAGLALSLLLALTLGLDLSPGFF